MNLHGFKYVYKPININVLFINVDNNGMAAHLTRYAVHPMQWMGLIMIRCGMTVRGWEC